MRILVICSAAPRADKNTMGIQQNYHRMRKLTDRHKFTIAYTNPVPENAMPMRNGSPFALVELPPPSPPPTMNAAPPKIYWQLRAWRQAFLADKPLVYQEHRDPRLASAISHLMETHAPDILHVIGEPMLYNVDGSSPNLLADFPDLFSNLFARNDSITRRTHQWQHEREVKKMKRVEQFILQQASAALFVSENDRRAAQALAPDARTFVVPNAVDLDFFQMGHVPVDPNSILFTGTLAYAPNIEALRFFVGEIFPHIQKTIPAAEFNIVGYNPPQEILAMQNARVHVHANVPDIRPFLAHAAVCVAPIRSGSGTRIKIIEAWAMHKAVVSTRIGAEGLGAQSGTHLRLADNGADFANAVIELLQNPERQCALGQAGHQLAVERYSLASAAEQLNAVYETISRSS